jgi:drug/metabolite transporter (DMT)-like permease
MATPRSPIVAGTVLAVVAAVAFGVTTPIIARAGRDAGPFTTAALLYAGAALSSLSLARRTHSGAPLGRRQLPRLVLVSLFGAVLAPVLLAWGLQRAGALTGALLLNLEALFTALLARAFYREHIGRRVAIALGVMLVGGVALTLDASRGGSFSVAGAVAVGGATLGWALDNTLTRPLSQHRPAAVVAGKAALGATLTTALALVARERLPTATNALALLACGATGYGASLQLYLLAQRRIGAARTGSIFAVAPFVGAALAWALGERSAGYLTAASAALFGAGVFLHVTERHRHAHVHPPMTHDHPHRHDDGHHDHVHDPPFEGEHAHAHTHERLAHAHEHAADIHHDHEHS